MAEREESRYLVIISLRDYTPQHLTEVVPRIQETLASVAVGPAQQAFRAMHGDTFGYFIRSRSHAGEIRARLESPGKNQIGATSQSDVPFLTNDDPLLVMEIGEDFSGRGFSRAWTWLQHH